MDVKNLYTLIAVMDCGSFQRAAKDLQMSVSNVSVHIKTLERQTGLNLFDRAQRPPMPTPEGRDFVARAREVVAHWEALHESLVQPVRRANLRLGTVHTPVAGALPPALRQLQNLAGPLDIRLITDLSIELEDQLQRNLLDCALVTEPDRLLSEFTYRPLALEPLMLIVPIETKGTTLETILSEEPYVRFNRRARVARLIDGELKRRNITVNTAMEVESLDGVIALVRNGLGVSIVPQNAGGAVFPKDIRAMPFGAPPLSRSLGLMARTDGPKQAIIDQLFDCLNARFNQPGNN